MVSGRSFYLCFHRLAKLFEINLPAQITIHRIRLEKKKDELTHQEFF
jgi:hypothetical protein